jgi:fibronectin-binding autotransporter adhesin
MMRQRLSTRAFQLIVRQFAVAILAAACSLLGVAASGQTLDYWTNLSGGNYETDSNWSLGAPGEYPTFNLGSAGYTVNMNQNNGAIDPDVETDNVTLNLNGYTYSTNYLDVSTAAGTNGSLTIQGPGTLQEDSGDVGYVDVGGSGQLTVNGASIVQNELYASLGVGGTLTVENGGSVIQNDLPGESMNIGDLIANNGTVNTQGPLGIGSGTLTNGSTVESTRGNVSVSGNVSIGYESSIYAFNNVDFTPTSSLTLMDGGQVGSANYSGGYFKSGLPIGWPQVALVQ